MTTTRPEPVICPLCRAPLRLFIARRVGSRHAWPSLACRACGLAQDEHGTLTLWAGGIIPARKLIAQP